MMEPELSESLPSPGFFKYPKINTLWKRDEDNKFCILPGQFSCPEFQAIKRWRPTEKIHGTNLRVILDQIPNHGVKRPSVWYRGKTKDAQIPSIMVDYLRKTFTPEILSAVFPEPSLVYLFGEGYGAKIQKGGGKYRPDPGFILFDIWVQCKLEEKRQIDGWWLSRENVKDVAEQLNLPSVPELGIMTMEEAIELVKGKRMSSVSQEELVAEGIVVRSHPLMLFRNGDPIMWKLKVRDYRQLAKLSGKQ